MRHPVSHKVCRTVMSQTIDLWISAYSIVRYSSTKSIRLWSSSLFGALIKTVRRRFFSLEGMSQQKKKHGRPSSVYTLNPWASFFWNSKQMMGSSFTSRSSSPTTSSYVAHASLYASEPSGMIPQLILILLTSFPFALMLKEYDFVPSSSLYSSVS